MAGQRRSWSDNPAGGIVATVICLVLFIVALTGHFPEHLGRRHTSHSTAAPGTGLWLLWIVLWGTATVVCAVLTVRAARRR